MSLENLIVDLTNAIKENTDATNKLIIVNSREADMAVSSAPVKEDKKPKAEKKKAPPKEVKKEEPVESKQKEESSDTSDNEAKYKHLQECLMALCVKYAESHEGTNPKKFGKDKAVEFMKDVTGCTVLSKVKPTQYEEFAQQLELQLEK